MSEHELKVQQKQEVQHNGETTKPEKYFVPAVDIYETEKQVIVIAEMSGVASDGVVVTLDADVLTIKGDTDDAEQPNTRVILHEFESGHYLRRFTVAETIDQENITASMNDGLLTVTLPKAEPAKPQKIEIKVD